jgi:hypothetical protein
MSALMFLQSWTEPSQAMCHRRWSR